MRAGPRDYDRLRDGGGRQDLYVFYQGGTGSVKPVGGFCDAPQDVDLVIIGRAGSECGPVHIQRSVQMQVYGCGRRLVFEIFSQVDVVEGRL